MACRAHGEVRVRVEGELLDRCRACGHRLETSGYVPVGTRFLFFRALRKASLVPVTELRGRRAAKRL